MRFARKGRDKMKSLKVKFSLIFALAFVMLAALGSFFGLTYAKADRQVSISGSSIFITTSDAKVWANRIGEGETAEDYTMFVLTADGDAVNFRQNLAYRWVQNVAAQSEEDDAAIIFEKQEGWFNMEIGFSDNGSGLGFEKYILTFESQQYTQTKDGKSTNYLVFEPSESDDKKVKVSVAHREDDDEDADEAISRAVEIGEVNYDRIKIEFTAQSEGTYTLSVGGLTHNELVFTNIGKTYSKRSSSTVTPVTPLSFTAKFKEGEENAEDNHGYALMTLYNLNGQSFKVTGAKEVTDDGGKHYSGGTVNDDTPPVLCLDKGVPFLKYNGEISFDYTVIDVLTSSPSLTTSYFMLTDSQAKDSAFKPEEYKEDGGIYRKVTDSDDQYMIPHKEHYLPTAADYDTAVYDDNFEVKAAVKVVLKLTDTTSTNGQSTYVLLDWFVDDDYLINLGGDENKAYIAVTTDKLGASYAYTQNGQSNPDESNADWENLKKDYQAEVDKAAKNLKAGSKNYFYLPSVKSLLGDNSTAYEDLTFSIYYNNGSQQQNSNKKSNELSINVNKPGKYIFTVYATDAAGNQMYYYKNSGGEGEKKEFTTGEIWNMYNEKENTEYEDMRKYLPWFEFDVAISEISIDDPEEQSTAYVGSTYTPDSFEINGVSYNTEYALYQFENSLYAKDNGGVAMTYEDFIAGKDNLLKNFRRYFTRIKPASELKEGTDDYDKFHDYNWNGSTLTFTPQSDNAFYLITCTANSQDDGQKAVANMGIAAAPKVDPIKGEDTWVQDNITSIVLLSIAGAALVGIVLLIFIKPKNKGDVDEAVFRSRPKRNKKDK